MPVFYRWHWISSALSLIGLLLFAFTGITLNHADLIESQPETVLIEGTLANEALEELQRLAEQMDASGESQAPIPASLREEWSRNHGARLSTRDAEWSHGEIYLSLPRPGGDGWIAIDIDSGAFEYESTSRGWIAYLNDLHKGRDTGIAWIAFIDLFAIACLVFALTGLAILALQAPRRWLVWPLVGAGFVIPALLALLFIH